MMTCSMRYSQHRPMSVHRPGAKALLQLIRPSLNATVRASHLRTMSTKQGQEGHIAAEPASEHSNRLAKEQSPYLLQHAHNPVDWYPWGQEAISKAKEEDKPIFLSVGYATCHWCHVMEHESFEDHETAELLNKHFISIKVDREERPDVDRVYMSYVQAMSGRGGWPMSVWLTPDLEPVYGGTYYPKEDIVRGGNLVMPGFNTVLRRIASLWTTNREDLKAKGTSIMSQLQQAMEGDKAAGAQAAEAGGIDLVQNDLAEHALTQCMAQLASRFDSRLGGFSGAPKFPRPSEINALLCAHAWHKVQGDKEAADEALHMATFTLSKMAAGGMYDHIGGGFHRYSVDEYWHVPHFEKMLYDNPQMVMAYLSVFQAAGDRQHAAVARGVLDYLRRDMMSSEGGLFSAEDADSFNPEAGRKTEGYFYVWTTQEVEQVLGADRAALFNEAYHLKPGGNCTLSPLSDPHHEFGGRNVPILREPLYKVAEQRSMTLPEVENILAECRQLLHKARQNKPRPALDDKIVCAWDGMGISAFALASRVLKSEQPPMQPCFPMEGVPLAEYLQCATRVAEFVKQHLLDNNTFTLIRSYRGGPSNVQGFADDYAYLIAGLLDLYSVGGGLQWLRLAVSLQHRMDSLFWDAQGGGYFSTTPDPHIKIRMKDSYDGAEPSASSIAASNLYRLASLLPGELQLQSVSGRLPFYIVNATAASKGVGNLMTRTKVIHALHSQLHQPEAMYSAVCPAACTDTAIAPAAAAGGGPASGSQQQAQLSWLDRAEQTLAAFKEQLFEAPLALPQMCCAAHLKLKAPLRQVIVACSPKQGGGMSAPEAQALLDAVHQAFAPDKAVHLIDLSVPDEVAFWSEHSKAALSMAQTHFDRHAGAPPTVFVCQNYTCQAPTTNPDQVVQLLVKGGVAPEPLQVATGLPGMPPVP